MVNSDGNEMKSKLDKNKQVMQKLIAKKNNSPKNVGAFAEDLKIEFKRITWPDRKTVIKSTVLILVIVVTATLFISMLDAAFSEALLFLKHI
ncbi:MAG: preprotein translocase subunit SecE [Candidatus Margulisbacteria bacterium]|nr:preprotein translocase subunit SecE [Candidatus Margulisiibacteriota bacterium]